LQEVVAPLKQMVSQAVKTLWRTQNNSPTRYGGPEEGGWWYDGYELEGGVPFASRTISTQP
jgi:hypothetical protein